MFIFITLALGAFLLVAGGFLFGHDHDAGDDVDSDTDGTISVFSIRVIGTFIMGFGAAGAIARFYNANYMVASIIGAGSGVMLALLMYGILLLFIRQQATSVITTESLAGKEGSVTVSIDRDSAGEVGISVNGDYRTYSARTEGKNAIPKGSKVRIVNTSGSSLMVEKIN